VDGLLATKSEGVELIVRAITFLIHQRHRRTDRLTTCNQLQDRALHYSASRCKV